MVDETSSGGRLRENRDYRLWWIVNLLYEFGIQVAMIAMPLLVLALTNSPFQAGLVASTVTLPYVVLSLPVGVLVDRYSRRALLIAAGVVGLTAFGSLAVALAFGQLTMAHLFVVAFANGVAASVVSVAKGTVLRPVVGKKNIGPATSQAETIERLAAVAGPPLGGLLFETVWQGAPFVVHAFTFMAVVLCIALIRTHLGPSQPIERTSVALSIATGVKVLWRHRLLRDLTILNSAGDFLFAGIGLLMIVLVLESSAGVTTVGVVFGMAAIGGMTGALLANRIEGWLGLSQAVIGKHVLTALLFPLLALPLAPMLIGGLWAVISFQVSILAVVQRKYLVMLAPESVLGRVDSVATFLSFGGLPLGIAGTGALLEVLGGRGTVLVYSALLVLLAVMSIASRSIRRPVPIMMEV